MKIPSLKALAKAGKERRGIALISVLTMMALTTILVLTFFSLAQNEFESSSTYSDGLQAQQIAEEAVNMVIRQIREATADPNLAWASQPGAIRTWDGGGKFAGPGSNCIPTMTWSWKGEARRKNPWWRMTTKNFRTGTIRRGVLWI